MNQPPRKRRRRRPPEQSTEEEYQSPRRRKKKRSGTKQKKSTKPNVPIGFIAGIAGVVVVVLIAIMVVDWKSVGQTIGVSNTPESLMKRLLSSYSEQVDILASIQDETSAQAAGPKLNKNGEEIAKTTFEIAQLLSADNKPGRDPFNFEDGYQEEFQPIAERLSQEMKRLGSNPALAATVKNMMLEANVERTRVTMELRLNKAKEGAYAAGFSPVTSSTELTTGMRIQVVDPLGQWTTQKITDVRTDGKVKIGASLVYIDRDRLRIPD